MIATPTSADPEILPMPNRSSTEDDIERLTRTVEDFCVWIESLPERGLHAQAWGPREVLAHLVYWHESYLTQSEAILAGRAYRLPSGRFADMNAEAVGRLCNLRPATLTRRFRAVNRRLSRLAEAYDPRKIAFRIKEGSKRWRLSDLIPAVEAHIRNHLRSLKKAFKGG
jgi:hypothetical protein